MRYRLVLALFTWAVGALGSCAGSSGTKEDSSFRAPSATRKECEKYLTCEATWCGSEAMKRCMRGESPDGRDNGGSRRVDCQKYLTCEAMWCGRAAMKRCEQGLPPEGSSHDEDNNGDGGDNNATDAECQKWLTCEATWCGAAAFKRCKNGQDPRGR